MYAIDLSADAQALIVHYLANRDETFSYCASCTDSIDTFTAQVFMKMGVEIKGTVTVD